MSVLKRMLLLVACFGGGMGAIVLVVTASSPWPNVLRTFDVILIDEDCGFSEISAACLRSTPRSAHERPRAVPVPTSIRGDLSHRACRVTRSAVAESGSLAARVSVWTMSEESWCLRLAQGARTWLLANTGGEQWPTFVHDGQLAGIGLLAEHFEAVGEPDTAARLPECIDTHLDHQRRSQP